MRFLGHPACNPISQRSDLFRQPTIFCFKLLWWTLLASSIKNSPSKGNPYLNFSLAYSNFQGVEHFLYFREGIFRQNPSITELSYISRKVYSERWNNRTFLYFTKGKFRTLAYSEPWHNRAFVYFRKGIFRTLTFLEL